jgi:CRP-like cAMP-binding protein
MMEELSKLSVNDLISYIIYTIAYLSALVAFSMSSMFLLRVLVILSSTCYVIYYLIYPVEPLWLDIIAEGIFALVNAVMLVVLWFKQSQLKFSDEEKLLYQTYFSSMSPFEYTKLIRIAKWTTCTKGYKLTEQAKVVSNLTFIYDGNADVIADGKKVIEVKTGSFVGEISFKLQQPANATVEAQKNTRVVQWPQGDLSELIAKNPGMRNCVEALISIDLAKKLRPKSAL